MEEKNEGILCLEIGLFALVAFLIGNIHVLVFPPEHLVWMCASLIFWLLLMGTTTGLCVVSLLRGYDGVQATIIIIACVVVCTSMLISPAIKYWP